MSTFLRIQNPTSISMIAVSRVVEVTHRGEENGAKHHDEAGENGLGDVGCRGKGKEVGCLIWVRGFVSNMEQ